MPVDTLTAKIVLPPEVEAPIRGRRIEKYAVFPKKEKVKRTKLDMRDQVSVRLVPFGWINGQKRNKLE